jgi:hypothetical protein
MKKDCIYIVKEVKQAFKSDIKNIASLKYISGNIIKLREYLVKSLVLNYLRN